MQVIVRDRQQGKTTDLVAWLLQGERRTNYPNWSRVILVHSNVLVAHTSNQVGRALQALPGTWFCERCPIHLAEQCEAYHEKLSADIRKAVWSFSDYSHNAHGRDFEYAIDNLDAWISMTFHGKGPAIVAMTGTLK